MGIHINNVNTPIHIGSRGMRRGSFSRQLRGIKKNNSVSSLDKSSPISVPVVDSSIPVVDSSIPVVESSIPVLKSSPAFSLPESSKKFSPAFSLSVTESSRNSCQINSSIPDDGIGKIFESEVKKLEAIVNIIGIENMDENGIEEAKNQLNSHPNLEVLNFMKPLLENLLEDRKNLIALRLELNRRNSESTVSDNENDLKRQLIEKENRIKELLSMKSPRDLSEKFEKQEKELNEFRSIIESGSDEGKLLDCMEKLRILKDRLGVTRDPLSQEFKVDDPIDLGKLLMMNIVISVLENDEIEFDNSLGSNFNSELIKEGDKTEFIENVSSGLSEMLKAAFKVSSEEIKVMLERIDPNWFELSVSDFQKKRESLSREIEQTIATSSISKTTKTMSGISSMAMRLSKEIFEIFRPFFPVIGKANISTDKDKNGKLDNTRKIEQLSLYMCQLHKNNPDVSMENKYNFSVNFLRMFGGFDERTVVVFKDPDMEQIVETIRTENDEVTFKPIEVVKRTNNSLFTRKEDMNNFIKNISVTNNIGLLFSIIYIVFRMRERSIEAGGKGHENWELDSFIEKVKSLSLQITNRPIIVTFDSERRAVLDNHYESQRVKFIESAKKELRGLNSPDEDINILFGETLIEKNGEVLDCFKFVQEKLGIFDTRRPTKSQDELDSRKISDANERKQKLDEEKRIKEGRNLEPVKPTEKVEEEEEEKPNLLRARLRKAVTKSSSKDNENVRIAKEFQPPNVRNRRIPPPIPEITNEEVKPEEVELPLPPPPPLPLPPLPPPIKVPRKAPTNAPPKNNFLEELRKRAKRIE